MSNIDVKVVIQLWQIVLSLLISGIVLLGAGYKAGRTFLPKEEFTEHEKKETTHFDRIYNEIRKLTESVNKMIGAKGG